jgi:para-nitrobenzyl esterase
MLKKTLFSLCLFSLALILLQAQISAATGVVVKTEYGRVKGFVDEHTRTFTWLGIPYAKSPVGDLRWKPPQEPDPWRGILKTEEFGNACAQVGGLYGPPAPGEPFGLSILNYLGLPSGCEDCLTLNIWRPVPSKKKEQLPVIVFIHGGSNKQSYAADPMWQGANLARKANAVVVTVNYRLGVFGWFAHPALRTGDLLNDSANFGTLDLIQALKFLKNNIANFGGDPENVTVMGQSAGAANVYSLMVSPLTEGLMDKAVLMSGPGLNGTPLIVGEGYANAVLRQLLIDDGIAADKAADWIASHTNEIAAYLRGKSTEKVLMALVHGGLTSPPNIFADGTVVPLDSNAEVNKGNFRNVPVIIGATLDEGKLFVPFLYKVSDAQRFTWMYEFDADNPSSLTAGDILNLPYYFPSPPFPSSLPPIKNLEDFENFTRNAPPPLFIGTQWFTDRIDETAARLRVWQPKVYAYRFEWNTEPEPWKTIYGAVHVLDTPFMFGNFQEQLFSCMYGHFNKRGRRALSDAMIASLAAFARSGSPNNSKLGVIWEEWSNADGGPKKLIFDADEKHLQVEMVYTTVLPPL